MIFRQKLFKFKQKKLQKVYYENLDPKLNQTVYVSHKRNAIFYNHFLASVLDRFVMCTDIKEHQPW